MVNLIAKSPCDGALPMEKGSLTLSAGPTVPITSVAPFIGQEAAVSAALRSEIGAAFPNPGCVTGESDAQVVWSGLGQALVLGPVVAPDGAAITDQSDAWTWLVLEGAQARDALAFVTPLDLRDSIFKPGQAARSLLGHMSCLFWRTGAERYEMLVFRSMAHTAIHELSTAMTFAAETG